MDKPLYATTEWPFASRIHQLCSLRVTTLGIQPCWPMTEGHLHYRVALFPPLSQTFDYVSRGTDFYTDFIWVWTIWTYRNMSQSCAQTQELLVP
jgi:hypothetical protein